jgi:hypothetical protein
MIVTDGHEGGRFLTVLDHLLQKPEETADPRT